MLEQVPAKTIITRTKQPDAWFGIDYNMNIYRGCCHGCIYCDSRSECYHVEDFDRVRVKENAIYTIRDELRRKTKTGVVGTGAMSDPYNPFEKELKLTRQALTLLDTYRFGAAIATKSNLIARDIDILQSIKQHSPVLCKITVTAWDDALCKTVEPCAPVSSERFEALARLSDAGIFAGVLMMPILPFIEDSGENISGIVKRAKESGARFIYPALGVTLRGNQREWFFQKLNELFPEQGLVEKYISQFGSAYGCHSPHAKKLWPVLAKNCEQAGILYRMKDIINAYRQDYDSRQMTLF